MKARETIILVLVLSLSLIPALQAGTARAQTPSQYSESLDVYAAGSNALWFMTFHGANMTGQSFTSVESVSGVTGYKLTAIKTESMLTDFQVFGPDGYNLLRMPFLPLQGMFLDVNASSQAAADSVASDFGSYLSAAFVPISSGGGTYAYFSPVDFSRVAAPLLYGLVPSSMKGFASLLKESSFAALSMPVITIEGQSTGSGFDHAVTIGGAEGGILSANGGLVMANVLKQPNSTLRASPSSASTEVNVHALDAIVVSPDSTATVKNSFGNFSGSYALKVAPGSKFNLNVTLVSQAPAVTAYRLLDRGTLSQGDFLSVTLVFHGGSTSGVAQNLRVNDSWWQGYPGLFQLTNGNSSFTVPSVSAGQNVTHTYVLKVLATSPADIFLPSSRVPYQYSYSGSTFNSSTYFNGAELRVNEVGPTLAFTARSSMPSGAPVGAAAAVLFSVTNSGNAPALNLQMGNYTDSNLVQGGAAWDFNMSVPVTSLLDTNFTRSFQLQWVTPNGQTENATSNLVSVIFSHTGMRMPLIQSAVNATVTSTALSARSLSVVFAYQNRGTANTTSVAFSQQLPAGVSCQNVTSGPGSCAGPSFGATVTTLTTKAPQTSSVSLSFSKENYIVLPGQLTTKFQGLTLHSYGDPFVIPAGLNITKSFSPNQLFQGMSASVNIAISNAGSIPVYNLTVSSAQDSFDTLRSGSLSEQRTYTSVVAGSNLNLSYSATASSTASGSLTPSAVQASFLFGGLQQSVFFQAAKVSIFKPLSASFSTVPANPTEGSDFTLRVTVTNPANVSVSGLSLAIPLPSGLQVVNATGAQLQKGSLLVSAPQVAANSNFTASAVVRASVGLDFDLSGSSLAFQYHGTKVSGVVQSAVVTVKEDIVTRYAFPIAIAILLLLAAAVYVKRRSSAPQA